MGDSVNRQIKTGILGLNSSFKNGGKFVGFSAFNMSSGDTDLYTCPSGKKAFVNFSHNINNSTAGSIVVYSQIKISGTYYALVKNTLTANQVTTVNLKSLVLEAGEILSINTDTAGVSIQGLIFEVDSSLPIIPFKIHASSGDNTLYTCPSGKVASIIPGSFYEDQVQPGRGPSAYNAAGSATTLTFYNVPSGGSTGATNKSGPTQNINSTASGALIADFQPLAQGDFIVVNSTQNSVFIWGAALEQ